MIAYIRRRLGWKIFLSFLVVILTGILVLRLSAEYVIPSAFDQHMAAMENMMGGQMMRGMGGRMFGGDSSLETGLFMSFRDAVNQALTRSALAAFAVASLLSLFISSRVVKPVREMMQASRRIAEGHYQERVQVAGDPDQADELSQLAISFNHMAEQLAQNEALRQRLIGDVTHELLTPLSTIKGSMEGLMDGVLPETAETYQKIYHEADRLARLVDDLQQLSRVEAEAYALERGPLPVDELVQKVEGRLRQQYEEKGVTLRVMIPPNLPEVHVDADRIEQVLMNVVGNALQYTPSGGDVVIKALQVGQFIHVEVQDNGIGIPLEHQPHIFTRFYRVDKSRARVSGGSGIGLTIARHLVEAHGGKIWVESAGRDQGSTFTFSLPVAQE
ncbi:MAG: HAMP domain-containing sensor histidine kinase [Anaerolineales bacterium]